MPSTVFESIAHWIDATLRQPLTVGHLVLAAMLRFLVHDVRRGGRVTRFMQPKERELAVMAKFGPPNSVGYVAGYFVAVWGWTLAAMIPIAALVILLG